MHRAIRGSALGVIIAAAVSGCGGGGATQQTPAIPKDPFAYNAAKPLDARVSPGATRGPGTVKDVSYVTFDGTRVPALLMIPHGGKTSGCLMYQPGVGSPKEIAARMAWPWAARLKLAVFTIDPRYTGARAGGPIKLTDVFRNLNLLIAFFRDDVIDLRRGIDFLEGQAVCHHNIGYIGVSEGGNLGEFLAGEDSRIRTAVICSSGATWRSRLFYSPYVLTQAKNEPGLFEQALAELAPLTQGRWIAKIAPRPVMIVDGLSDPAIPPVDGLDLYAAARQPKTLLLDPGGHVPFVGPYAPATTAKIAAFLNKNLVHDGDQS